MSLKALNKHAQNVAENRNLDIVVKVSLSSTHAGTLRTLFHKMADNDMERSDEHTIIIQPEKMEILGHQTGFNEVSASFSPQGVKQAKGDFVLYVGLKNSAELTRQDILRELKTVFNDDKFSAIIDKRLSNDTCSAPSYEPRASRPRPNQQNEMRIKLDQPSNP